MISRWMVLLLTATLVMSELSQSDEINSNIPEYQSLARSEHHIRHARAIQSPPVGFFGKIAYVGGLIYQQYNETRSVFSQLRGIIQDSFSDTATTTKKPLGRTKTTTAAPDGEGEESTTEKYRISRAEFGRILSRNWRGLQKLFRIEVDDARNQTRYTIADYKNQYFEQVKPPNKRIKVTVNKRENNFV